MGGSWRYIAGELYRGSYRSRSPERTGLGRQLAVYSRGGFAEEDAGGRKKKEEKDGRKLRNLTTPTQSGGEKLKICMRPWIRRYLFFLDLCPWRAEPLK